MKNFTKILLLIVAFALSTNVILAQGSLFPDNSEKARAELAELQNQHGPTVVVPKSTGSRAVGDDCSAPIEIGDLAIGDTYSDLGQTTCGRGNNYSDTQLGSYDGGEDVIYTFSVTERGVYSFTFDPKGTAWTGIAVFDGCPTTDNVVGGSGAGSGDERVYSDVLEIGDYYFMADTWPTPDCIPEFDLSISSRAVLPGEECTGPLDYGMVNDLPSTGSIESYETVWYTYEAGSNMIVNVSLCGSDFDTKLWVYENCDDDYIHYNDDECGVQSEVTGILMLTGDKLLVKVGGYGSNSGDYELLITGGSADPSLAISPAQLDLGMWPIDGWQEDATLTITNDGFIPVEVKGSDLEDIDGAFSYTDLEIPSTLLADEFLEVGFNFVGENAGAFEGIYVVNYGESRSILTARVAVEGYAALEGDIFENPFDGNAVAYPHTVTIADMKGNYNTPLADADTKDAVYAFTLANDSKLTVSSTVVDVTFAVYTSDFGGNPGPMADNAMLSGAIADEAVFAGDYFIVASSPLDIDFDVTIAADLMDIPVIAFNPTPEHEDNDIAPNSLQLSWETDEFANEYRLLFGTEFPPTEVLVDWTDLALTYDLADLAFTTQYFWRVDLRNTTGEAEGDVWGFTTTIPIPTALSAVVADTNDVVLTWPALDGALGYNVFRDGVQLNADLLTAVTYTEMDVPSNECAAAAGYVYSVEAEFTEGVSDTIAAPPPAVSINGTGTVDGTVKELLDPFLPLSGVTVTLTSTTGGDDYVFTTDATGAYAGVVYRDTYDYEVVLEGYITATLDVVIVPCDPAVTNDFDLDEFPYPVTSVTAVEQDEDNVFVTWVYDARAVVEYNIYRYNCDGTGEVFLGSVINGNQFLDQTWGDVTGFGTYKWGVEVVYTNNSAFAYSECLDKNMEAVVDVAVTTNSDDSPAGTLVVFTNTADDTYSYSIELDGTGTHQFFPVRKGNYDYTVFLTGFASIDGNVDIIADAAFDWELIELLNTIVDGSLYVTPLGYATWIDPNAVVDVDYMDVNFDAGIPADWTITHNGTERDTTWEVRDDYFGSTIDGTPFAFTFSWSGGTGGFAADEVLTTNTIDASSAFELFLDFDHYYNRWNGPESGNIEVFDGTDWQLAASFGDTDAGSWSAPDHQHIDVSAFANAAFAVRFHYTADDEYYWAVDNVKIYGRAVGSAKQFLSYRVWHDGVFAADVEVANYQYGDNPENILVSGDTYTAEVANEYSSGFSARVAFDWTYVPCEEFPGNTNLAAVYVDGTTSNLVSWDALDADLTIDAQTFEILGTNIYRDGEMLAFVANGTASYSDDNMASGSYTYCTEVVYTLDAGAHKWESCSANCVSDVVVPEDIFGMVSGFVYDFIGNAPLASANVSISNDDNSYDLITDETGYYEAEVVIGTYDYTASAAGFTSEDRAGIVVVYGATAMEDFYLNEVAYPVGNVHATELDENTVKVTWGEVAVNSWITYHNGDDMTNNYGTGEDYSIEWANKFLAADLAELDGGAITKINMWKVDVANSYILRISQGDDYTEIYQEDITSAVTADGWNEITLATAVAFDVTETLWVAIYCEATGGQYVSPVTNSTGSTDGDWFSFNGGDFGQIAGLGNPGKAWMLEAFVTDEAGKSAVIGNYAKAETKDYSYSNATLQVRDADLPSVEPTKTFTLDRSSKSLLGYNIYRLPCTEEAVAAEYFIGYTLDEASFTDNSWGTSDWGMYKWAVEAVYTNNTSEAAFSAECIDKDMNTLVNMTVTTNSGDSPSATRVVFVNTLEEDVENIESTIPGTGLKTIDPFRKGTYDITVTKLGFVTIEVIGAVIHDETDFVWEMIEILDGPANLYVTPTGLATWLGQDVPEFMPFFDNFDAEDSFDAWEVVVGGNTADTWFWNDGTNGQYQETLDGTPYVFVDSDDAGSSSTMDELFISPVIDASMVGELYVEFDQFYNNLSSEELADVEVYDGSDWVTVLHQAADAGAWGAADHVSIDVSEFANAEFRVRFHYLAPGWDWHWAIDNVSVHDNTGESSDKAVEDFLVYHDDTYSGSTQEEFYQYGNNEVLVSGETYFAEVATVYSTGTSERMNYTWTYLPCDSFPNYSFVEANHVVGSDDVLVQWSTDATSTTPEDFFEGFEDGTLPTGWMSYDEDGDSYIWDNTAVEFDSFEAHTGDYCMTSASYRNDVGALTPDNWLVTPPIIIGSSSELSFWATAQDPAWADEQYYVKVSTTGNAVADFTTTIYDAIVTGSWGEVVLDLGDFAGETVYIAFQHADVTDMFFLNLDDVMVTATPTRAAYTAPVAAGTSKGMPFRTSNMEQDEINSQLAAYNAKSRNDATEMGANIYRDGEMIAFVAVPDTFFMDMDLASGYYDYCVEKVYTQDEGVHVWSCESTCVDDVLVPEDCIVPMGLTATDELNDGYTATLNWETVIPSSEWLQYDIDVQGYGGIGAEASDYSLTWACKFVPEDLTDYSTGYVTKIAVSQGAAAGDYVTEVRVLSGDGTNVLYTQDVTGMLIEGWNEITLAEAVPFDNEENLWIAMYVERPGGSFNEPTSDVATVMTDRYDFFAYNGSSWTTIYGEYGINFQGWMLRGFVSTSANGAPVALGHVDLNDGDYTTYTNSTSTGNGMVVVEADYPKFSPTNTTAFIGYNVYRDGDMIVSGLEETTYLDEVGVSGEVCYTVTASYEFCEESDHSNQACVDVGVGVNDLDNEVAVYPNPATDYVMVEANSNIRSIEITNYMGQVVSSTKSVELTQTRIETSSLSAGVYFVEVETVAGIEKVRIVISK